MIRLSLKAPLSENYGHIFRERSPPNGLLNLDDFLFLMPQLTDEIKTKLEGGITAGEVEQAMHSLARQKTPCPDSLWEEFYELFKKEICPLSLFILREAYDKQRKPHSFADAQTILTHKSDDTVKKRSVTG